MMIKRTPRSARRVGSNRTVLIACMLLLSLLLLAETSKVGGSLRATQLYFPLR